ncbi:MAG: single-stranded DNA-binding protein [Flammeovirgaceae bacterium]|nr:single-stranded DNA-binding protein [Flammeovirgaceae bacterium]MDW8287815.1 single-stranded DNA-binding protein [Flammeovirgaceae bacterium]
MTATKTNRGSYIWHTIIFWRSMADIAEKYIKKGSLLYIEPQL